MCMGEYGTRLCSWPQAGTMLHSLCRHQHYCCCCCWHSQYNTRTPAIHLNLSTSFVHDHRRAPSDVDCASNTTTNSSILRSTTTGVETTAETGTARRHSLPQHSGLHASMTSNAVRLLMQNASSTVNDSSTLSSTTTGAQATADVGNRQQTLGFHVQRFTSN